VSGRKRAAARAARLAAAKDWPALPGDEHIRATEQFLWAIDEMAASRLDWKAAPFAINPAISAAWPEVPAAWDRLLDELLERFPCGTVPPVLAKYLTVRLVERCPDMARLQRVAKLVRLVLGGDDIGKREIGKPEAVIHAARITTITGAWGSLSGSARSPSTSAGSVLLWRRAGYRTGSAARRTTSCTITTRNTAAEIVRLSKNCPR
jgi:hypothetical protein